MIRHRLQRMQPRIDPYCAHTLDQRGLHIRRILKMPVVATTRIWVKARHDAAQAVCPIAGAKSLAFAGHALNDEIGRFAGRV